MIEHLQNEYGFVYGIQSLDLIKVGVALDIDKRLHIMRLHNPHGCELVFYRKVYAPYKFERAMHALLADKAVGREWFRASLSEVRQAALTARLSSIRAKRAADRPLRFPVKVGAGSIFVHSTNYDLMHVAVREALENMGFSHRRYFQQNPRTGLYLSVTS